MKIRQTSKALALALALALVVTMLPVTAVGQSIDDEQQPVSEALRQRVLEQRERKITQEQREAAADRLAEQQAAVAEQIEAGEISASALTTPVPGGVPDYHTYPNWAYTPPLRKFVDTLPGVGPANANNLGQFVSVAHPDTITYPGSDYYEIELVEYTEQMHSDLPPTTLRGYRQTNFGTDAGGANTIPPDPVHYLGPMIFAEKDRPVRVKFTNSLPTGEGGDLFIPVDTSVMGAGEGPTGELYTQNRASLHLHGGRTPWISDGTPHQWITPADEVTPYPEGVSVENVPDMPDPGPGSMTFFYSNQQSARLLWYHDHAFGITRLNVYVGGAAPYLLTDPVEEELVADGIIPSEQIALTIQDKTFVDAETIRDTDPTWAWGTGPDNDGDGYPDPKTGDLWMPHVYVPAQNPYDVEGVNPWGRWHYGPWFWPPTENVEVGPIPNPYYDPVNAPWQAPEIPGTPNPSMGMESFFDTPMVNGTAYPTMEVDPKAYRFRVLNAANDRFWNLQLYEAIPTVQAGRTSGANRYATAVQSALKAFPKWTGVQHVIIASGENASQVDALAGAGLAGVYDAPLLLTERDSIPAVTRSALLAMPDGIKIHIVGGPAAVSTQVMSSLGSIAGVTGVDRVSGANRYGTAAAVGARMKSVLGSSFPTSAFIVNGSTPQNFYDSLVASPASYTMHYPILLVSNTGVPGETVGALSSLGITRKYIVGGTAAVSASVASSLGVPSGDRIWGSNRFSTATAFANRAVAEGWLAWDEVGVASSLVDALSGGVAMGALNGPMLLTSSTTLATATRSLLTAHSWDVAWGTVFGGTSVVSQSVLQAIIDILAKATEVKMVPASTTQSYFPADWPTDGRAGGVPDPRTAGPDFIQIGTEGGFLPTPVVMPQQPITWVMDPTVFNVGNVDLHTILLGPAERADLIIDFSQYAGKTLILYNDAPAAFPALDPRYDFYTGAPDLRDTGGYGPIKPGYGPNTRTIMQIKVKDVAPAPAYDTAPLMAAFKTTNGQPGAFARSQEPIIVGQAAYNEAYETTFSATWPNWGLVRIQDNELHFQTLDSTEATVPLEPKAIQDEMGEAFDPIYGRMSGMLGLERPNTVAGLQNFMLYPFMSPPVDIIEEGVSGTYIGEAGDNTQIWKITHNGVDTHPIHFHLYEVQLINRVGWDGIIRLPHPTELGWKETVRVSPLEDTIVALRPKLPVVPFDVPNSVRPINPAMPIGAVLFDDGEIQDPIGEPVGPLLNTMVNFGWEYVIHCHILSHEEMDMMHGVAMAVKPRAPSGLGAAAVAGPAVDLTWTDESHNETGFRIERSEDASFTVGLTEFTVGEGVTGYSDTSVVAATTYYYRVFAINTVGDTTDYTVANPQSIGFPTKTAASLPSNAVSVTP
ncbi:MAG: cell wall-binding repeat-containing protein [Anaerosomatales bacterium]|nr:cell wall-binding repeat-containing protein [Anaerosomatales bacterium]